MSSTTITDLDFGLSLGYDKNIDNDHIHYTASRKVEEETSPKTKEHDEDIVTISNNSYNKDAIAPTVIYSGSAQDAQERVQNIMETEQYSQEHSMMGNDIEDIFDNILEDAHHILTSHTSSMKQKMEVSNALMSLNLQNYGDFVGSPNNFGGSLGLKDSEKLNNVLDDKNNYFYDKMPSSGLDFSGVNNMDLAGYGSLGSYNYGDLIKNTQQQLKTPEQQELYEIYTNNMIAGAVAGNGGISSLDIHVKEITNHTDKGDETSYQFSFSQSAQTAQGQEAAPALMDPTEGFAPTQAYRKSWLEYVSADIDTNPWDGRITPSTTSDTTKASGSLYSSTVDENGNEAGIEASMRYDEYQAKLGQEIIDELFGGTKSASKEASKNNQINITKEAQIKTAKELHLQASFSYSKNIQKGTTVTNKLV